MYIQEWFPLGLTDWTSLKSKGFSSTFSNTTVQKHQFFSVQLSALVIPNSTISSSVVHFSLCPQSFSASGSFQVSQFFSSGGQSIGVSASASVLPMNTQDWSPVGWTGSISLQSKDSQESSPTPQFKSINSFALSFLHSLTPLKCQNKKVWPWNPSSL